jgi:hypothetical protein
VAIGGLGWAHGKSVQMAIGILLVISTLANMITIGPVCYPIVAETPSGRLRYKTIVIGRFVYNLTGIFSNSVTPRMLSPTCKSSSFNHDKTPRRFVNYADALSTAKLGIGEPKLVSFMLAPTFSATFGAGSAFLRPRIAPLARLTCSSIITFTRESSSIPRSIVSYLLALLLGQGRT